MISVLVLSVVLSSAPDDRWFAPDKFEHAGGSVLIAAFGYSGGLLLGQGPKDRAITGLTLSFGIATSWEMWSLLGRGGYASVKDLIWGFAGGIAAIAILHLVTTQ